MSFWKQLEAIGLEEIVMVERVKAIRAIDNARGGPLSVKKKPAQPPARELGRLLREIMEIAEGDRR